MKLSELEKEIVRVALENSIGVHQQLKGKHWIHYNQELMVHDYSNREWDDVYSELINKLN